MKEMKYQSDRKIELLDTGKCCGYTYYILNLGTHPTAYIDIPKSHKYYEKGYNDIDLPVRYGLTYARSHLYIAKDKKINGWFLGWDYGHYGDYGGYEELLPLEFRAGGKRWTTAEIQQEVFEACKELERINHEK